MSKDWPRAATYLHRKTEKHLRGTISKGDEIEKKTYTEIGKEVTEPQTEKKETDGDLKEKS